MNNCDSCKINKLCNGKYKCTTKEKCKLEGWYNRHKNISLQSWSDEDLFVFVSNILLEKTNLLNDLLDKLNSKTLDDLCVAYKKLKLHNKTMFVKVLCENCGKEIEKHPSVYLKNKDFYCSKECYALDKGNKVGRGKDNIGYKRIKTYCTNCGREINIIPFDYNKENSFGDNHNFCTQECYWEYRSKYYVKEKTYMYNKTFSNEVKEKMRISSANRMKDLKRLDTKIQIITNEILDDNHVKYEREYVIKYYAVDNYLTEYNLIIEVMGDFWHCSPLKYNENKYKIIKRQINYIRHDKQKHTYIKNHNNINILYLWELDILKNRELCSKLILEYINNKGILRNYNSFNYSIDNNNKLVLNKNIIKAYQEMPTENYKYMAVS